MERQMSPAEINDKLEAARIGKKTELVHHLKITAANEYDVTVAAELLSDKEKTEYFSAQSAFLLSVFLFSLYCLFIVRRCLYYDFGEIVKVSLFSNKF